VPSTNVVQCNVCEDELASETSLVLHRSKKHFSSGVFLEKNNPSWLQPTGNDGERRRRVFGVVSLDEMNAATERQWTTVNAPYNNK